MPLKYTHFSKLSFGHHAMGVADRITLRIVESAPKPGDSRLAQCFSVEITEGIN